MSNKNRKCPECAGFVRPSAEFCDSCGWHIGPELEEDRRARLGLTADDDAADDGDDDNAAGESGTDDADDGADDAADDAADDGAGEAAPGPAAGKQNKKPFLRWKD